jgi:hypothetical protein
MSVTVNLNGQDHVLPVVREKHWGGSVTQFFQDEVRVLDGTFHDLTISTGATTIDLGSGRHNGSINLNSSTVFTLTNPREGVGSTFFLYYAGPYTPTFPSNFRWARGAPANSPPAFTSIAGRFDVVTFMWNPIKNQYAAEFALNFLT